MNKLSEHIVLAAHRGDQAHAPENTMHAFERASGVTIPYVIAKRRPGDIAACYADPAKARAVLGWQAERGIEEMCRDSWNWQKNNPNGFQTD